jgi:YVTN family beta-propeller protein
MIRWVRFGAPGLTLVLLSACAAGVSQTRPPAAFTAYVVNEGSNTVTAFNARTGRVVTTIKVGAGPAAIAITPDGTMAYVVNEVGHTVTPVGIATATPGTPIKVGRRPSPIAITPMAQPPTSPAHRTER